MGNYIDGLWSVVLIVMFLVTALTCMVVLAAFYAVVSVDFAHVPAAVNVANEAMDWIALMDSGVIFVFFSYVVVMLLLSYFLPTHPIFSVLLLVIVIVQIPVVDALKYFVNEMINRPEFVAYAGSFTNTLLLLEWAPVLVVAIGVLCFIVQVGKPGAGGGGIYG